MAQTFEVTDLEVVSEFFREQYTSTRLSARGDQHLLRVVQEQLGRARTDRMTFRMHLDVECEPLQTLCFGHVHGGRVGYRFGRDELRCRQGSVYLVAQPDVSFSGSIRDLDADFTFLEPKLLGEVAQNGPGVRGPVSIVGNRPYSPLAGAQWARTVAMVRTLVTSSRTVSGPLVGAQAARLLAAATLTAFPNTALTEPTIEDRRDAHPATVHRAVAFIEANPHRDLTVTDIAAAARVSVRAVQLAFRRHLDTTPMRYLRHVRLHHAHEQLYDAVRGDGVTVTGVAAQWGFSSPGRFSALYRQEFGRPPSDALRDRRTG
ncbi:helix-turn-helix domain-containing protein [Streptomyces sp. NPDC004111]|uniref:helix-turn-helix domain-containing protein n=1 Tax=Streptomyces sp. NPDC004111 TaxID=3364690 RepID=UPI00367ADF7A